MFRLPWSRIALESISGSGLCRFGDAGNELFEYGMTLVKRIGIATARITLSNGLVRLLSLISMPILTRLLSTSAYGQAAMAGTVISLVSVIALAGMDMSYMRAYFSSTPDRREAVEYFSWRFTVFAGFIASACVVVSWSWFAGQVALPNYLGWLVAAGTFFAMLGTMAQTRARLKMTATEACQTPSLYRA